MGPQVRSAGPLTVIDANMDSIESPLGSTLSDLSPSTISSPGGGADIGPQLESMLAMGVGDLTAMEAAEVRAILQSALDKLALVSVITSDAPAQAEELTRAVGDEITRAMAEQRDLEKRFETLVAARAALRTVPNKSKLKENEDELHAVADKLRESTKLLRRNLKDNPNVADNMQKVQTERSRLQGLLARTLAEVDSQGKFTKIVSAIVEEEAAERLQKEIVEREKAASSAVRALRVQVKEEKAKDEEEMRERGKALAALKEDLKLLKTKTRSETGYRSKEAAASATCTVRLHDSQLRQLEDEAERLKALIEVEKRVNAETAVFMKRRTAEMREEALKWAAKHEADTQRLDRDIEALKELKERDGLVLEELETRYKAEMAEKEAREAELRRLEELRVEMQADTERKTKACRKIQAVFRGYMVRVSMGKAGGGKKKGKKGKSPKGGKGGKSPKTKKKK